MSDDLTERVAKYLAETYNGGLWEDYTEEQKEVHRKRALFVFALQEEYEPHALDIFDCAGGYGDRFD